MIDVFFVKQIISFQFWQSIQFYIIPGIILLATTDRYLDNPPLETPRTQT